MRYFFEAGHPLFSLFSVGGFSILVVILALWAVTWKGIGLWVAARNYQRNWFIALLVLETAGILPIIYLLFFRLDRKEGVTKSLFNNPAPEPEEEKAGVAETSTT